MLEKITLEDIQPSSRRYPFIQFKPDREVGNDLLTVTNLSKTIDGVKILDNLSFSINRNDKVALVGDDEVAKTVLFQILAGEMELMKVAINGVSQQAKATSRKTTPNSLRKTT